MHAGEAFPHLSSMIAVRNYCATHGEPSHTRPPNHGAGHFLGAAQRMEPMEQMEQMFRKFPKTRALRDFPKLPFHLFHLFHHHSRPTDHPLITWKNFPRFLASPRPRGMWGKSLV